MIKNIDRYEMRSARIPPIDGPSTVPPAVAVCRSPSAYPIFSVGVVIETRAREAAIYPLMSPCRSRKARSW